MKKKEKFFNIYKCSITGESFKIFGKLVKTQDLLSLKAYYSMHPEEDDRPLSIKKKESLNQ
jgi:hypothetical protein